MGRPAGAAAAGCGGFGLIGILISVAIIAWLASQTIGGLGGNGDDDTPPNTQKTQTFDDTSTQRRVEASLDPTGPVSDAQVVRICADPVNDETTGEMTSGASGSVSVTAWQCIASGPSTVPLTTRCVKAPAADDETTTGSQPSSPWSLTVEVSQRISPASSDTSHTDTPTSDGELPDSATDCASAPAKCVLMLRADDGSVAAVAPLTFGA